MTDDFALNERALAWIDGLSALLPQAGSGAGARRGGRAGRHRRLPRASVKSPFKLQ